MYSCTYKQPTRIAGQYNLSELELRIIDLLGELHSDIPNYWLSIPIYGRMTKISVIRNVSF